MKKVMCILVIAMLITNSAYAGEGEDGSFLGKTLDETLSPLKALLTPSVRLDPIVVTPSRYEEPSLNVSKNITVINRERIKKSNARYVPELLKQEAGILVRDFIGNGKTVQVDMRGFGESSVSNVLVLIDGRRTNQVDISGTDWAQIDVDSIERIEVVRGGQTVLYGDNATGGVINIITKKGKGERPEIGFKYQAGTYDYYLYKGHITGGSEFLDYYAGLSHSYTDGHRTNNHLEATDFNANVTVKPEDYLHLKFYGGYHKDWFGMPGALSQPNLNMLGRTGSAFPNDRSKTEDFYLMFGPELTFDVGFGEILFSGDILTRGRRTNSIFFSTWGTTEITNHIKTFGVTPKIAFTQDFLGMHNRMIAGLDYYGHKDEILSGSPGSKDTIVIEKKSFGLYATDTIDISPSFNLNAGFRGEWAFFRFDQQARLQGKNIKSPFEHAIEVGINYKYNDRSSIYANYSRSFRFPAVDEWYSALWEFWGLQGGGLNLNLKPQVGNNYEIGIKENSSKYLGLKASYFIMDLKKEIYFDPVMLRNASYPHTVHHGLELEAHAYLFDTIDTFINYTYEKAFFVGDSFAGNEIPMVPRHKLTAGFDYTFMDSVNINYLINFIGKRRFISDQRNIVPRLKAYSTHDLKMSYYKHGFEVFTAVYNIFNEQYSDFGVTNQAGTAQNYYPAPGRNFLAGVSYKF